MNDGDPITETADVRQAINFPGLLWQRVLDRASGEAGMPILLNGGPATMRYMNPGYLVAVLVKRGLDQLDVADEASQ